VGIGVLVRHGAIGDVGLALLAVGGGLRDASVFRQVRG
jgi:hypothetical protein